MDYKHIYDSIVARGQTQVLPGYGEKHHIVPRCMGGMNTKENIVRLTAREHYVAHLCLCRLTTGSDHYKMSLAIMRFKKRGTATNVHMNSHLYDRARQVVAEHMRQIRIGQTVTEETRQKMSEAAKKRVRTPEHCRNISLGKKGRPVHSVGGRMTGKQHNAESRRKMSESRIDYWLRKHKENAYAA